MKIFTLRKLAVTTSCCILAALNADAQFSFTNSNSLLTPNTMRSGCAVAVADVNNDGLDDIIRMDDGTTLNVDLQQRDGSFDTYDLGNISGSGRVWAMAVADIDHNGWLDVVTGTSGQLYLVKLSHNGTTIVANSAAVANSNYFVQNITFGDMDNDGWVDIYVCDDDDYGKVYRNNSGTLVQTLSLINTAPGAPQTYGGDPADSGNYGSVWTDFDNDGDLDLFVAHCRQSTSSSTDLRRKDRMFVNNGSGVYTESASAYGIETTGFKQTWTASFGDIDNDGDLDLLVTNHGESGQIFLNDGSGNFTVLSGSGFSTNFDPIESFLEDFDNDGYLDILITGDEWLVYHNNGDHTFTQMGSVFANLGGMLSFATGDLNHDGRIDVFASYGDVYNQPGSDDDVLYLNTTDNENHFITFDLEGSTADVNAIGARVTITGAWGTQVREVRSGESYGTANSFHLHFGLGQNTEVTSAVVWFPSGTTITLNNLDADQFVTVKESSCSITGNIIPGSHILCTGQSTTLTAASGYSSYLWSNGETTQAINVSTTGAYDVQVTSGGCSNISPLINIELNPDETPTVTAAGTLVFCEGGSVELEGISGSATAYLWAPGGETTQTITADAGGTYSLTIQGACGSFTSDDVVVTALAAADPVAQDVALSSPGSTTLNATGNNPQWYDQPTNGTLLHTGNSFTTPVLNTSTTYYVQDTTLHQGETEYTGMTAHSGSSAFSANTTNAIMYFDVSENCTLKTAKVYTDTPGNRVIQVKASDGVTVLGSATVNIPNGESRITLNIALTPGSGYQLTTDGTVNNTNFGYVSPRLQRNSANVAYPYTIDALSITSSNQGTQYYYYLYDWEVQKESTVCTSNRVPVVVDVLTGINTINATGISLYPNPAKDKLFVKLNEQSYASVYVNVMDIEGRSIIQNAFYNTAPAQNLEVGLGSLAEGIYMVKVMAGGVENVYRVVVR